MKALHFEAIAATRVDRESGILYGVSVITEGEARGHGVYIDTTTLQSISKIASEFAGGVKVKADHHTGFDAIVGTLRNFRIDGPSVRADLHLIKSHPRFEAICEMAETMPEAFGLSIAFSGDEEDIGGRSYIRPSELYSVDLVDDPAANPTGLFRQVDSNTPTTMQSFSEFFGELKAYLSREKDTQLQTELSALKSKLSDTEQELSSLRAASAEATTKITALEAEKAALEAKLTETTESVGKLAAAKAIEITAAQGVPEPLSVKPDAAAPSGNSLADEYLSLSKTDPVKAAQFYNKNVKAIRSEWRQRRKG